MTSKNAKSHALPSSETMAPPAGDAREEDGERDDQGTGAALRSAYQAMVDEDIPQELLDLLNKLD